MRLRNMGWREQGGGLLGPAGPSSRREWRGAEEGLIHFCVISCILDAGGYRREALVRPPVIEEIMPEKNAILPIEIHLPGLLKLLGESLYSTPRVALRELVQNAHDSCIRRREEDPAAARGYAPAIHIWAEREARQVVIEDNGSGPTRDEITGFLSTVW